MATLNVSTLSWFELSSWRILYTVFCFPIQSTVNSVSLFDVKIATVDLCLLIAAVFNVGHTDADIFHYDILKDNFAKRQGCKCEDVFVQGINVFLATSGWQEFFILKHNITCQQGIVMILILTLMFYFEAYFYLCLILNLQNQLCCNVL